MQRVASPSPGASLVNRPPSVEPIDIESEVEDEIDQLDSDSDVEGSEPDASSASMKRSGTGRGGERTPGHSLLPVLRLENIIQADGVTGNLALSKEGFFILSIATEEFIKKLAQGGQLQASADRRNYINYRDMAATTQQYQEFMFLHDTIPAPLPLSEALQLRETKEKELLEEDPAMLTSTHISASASITGPGYSGVPRGKGKSSRVTNGKEKTNNGNRGSRLVDIPDSERWNHDDLGHDNAIHGSERVDSIGGTWIDWADQEGRGPRLGRDHFASQPTQNGITPSSTTRASPVSNGQNRTPYARREALTPPRSRDERMEHPALHHSRHSHTSPFHPQDESWPGQFTGPASGFLQDPRGPFSRVSQNPGRTIYSQQHRPQ